MSKLALKLIAENKKTRDTFLDLGNCDLTEIPKELGELVWLEEVSFSDMWVDNMGLRRSKNKGGKNQLTSLFARDKSNPLSKLTKLKSLCVNDNKELDDLSPLSSLIRLQLLEMRGTQVSELSPLSSLIGLKRLDMSDTQVSDLSPLSNMIGVLILYDVTIQ